MTRLRAGGPPSNKVLAVALLIASILVPSTAHANMGIPMLGVAWPIAWISYLPIVLIEGAIARRIMKLPAGRAMKVSAAANAMSTIVGIPATWIVGVLVMAPVTLIMPEGVLAALGPLQWALKLFWLPPLTYLGNRGWPVPLAEIVLCIPFLLASVWIEYRVARRMLPGIEPRDVRRWSLTANGISYGTIVLFLAAWAILEML